MPPWKIPRSQKKVMEFVEYWRLATLPMFSKYRDVPMFVFNVSVMSSDGISTYYFHVFSWHDIRSYVSYGRTVTMTLSSMQSDQS